jgi:hypothetical protein
VTRFSVAWPACGVFDDLCVLVFRRVGIDMPTIEVRFELLVAEAEVRVGDSGLPTVLNSFTNTLEVPPPLAAPSRFSPSICACACLPKIHSIDLIWCECVYDRRKRRTRCGYSPTGSGPCPSSTTSAASSSPAGENISLSFSSLHRKHACIPVEYNLQTLTRVFRASIDYVASSTSRSFRFLCAG